MAKKKISRKELLKGPDEFLTLSSRVVEYFNTHTHQLQYAVVALLVIGVVYLSIHFWKGIVNEKGQDAYNAAAKSMLTNVMKPDASPEDLKKTGELFSEVINDHGMSKVFRVALSQAAYVKFLEKDYDEAINTYKKFLDRAAGNIQDESLARLGLAACYEAKGDFKSGIDTLNPLSKDQSDCPFNEMALWNLSRLYRLDNNPQKSEETLKQFVEKYKTSPFYAMAKARL
jgi:tetratricopeptide (TPR) repeat protein